MNRRQFIQLASGLLVPASLASGQIILRRPQFPASSYDSDAQAFFDAAGITDSTQKSAVNQLVLDLKSYSIWTKMSAIYPFVGGTGTTHKYNLKDPRDLNAAFRLSIAGSWTHNSNGAASTGSSGDYINTNLTPSLVLNQNSKHMSVYLRNAVTGSPIGVSDPNAPGGNSADEIIFDSSSSGYFEQSTSFPFYLTGISYTSGFWLTTRTSSTAQAAYKNGSSIGTSTEASVDNPTIPVFMGCRDVDSSISNAAAFQIAFASIGAGLTSTEVSNFRTAVQAYQTTLGRQV